MNSALTTAKQMFPRLPWADGAIVTTLGVRTHVIVGRHVVTFVGTAFESKSYRATSGTSRKARKA
jgi:hypothetical protein